MTVSASTNLQHFSLESTSASKPSNGFVSTVLRALEISGRNRAKAYFAQKTDAELAQLGLTRALISERLSG